MTAARVLAWLRGWADGRAPEARHHLGAAPSVAGANHWARVATVFETVMAADGSRHRPNYLWCVLHAADVARNLGVARISALELGVAGGNGLIALEAAAA